MTIEGVIAQAAAAENIIWLSDCTIDRPTPGGDAFDPDQGGYLPAELLRTYTGACQIRPLRPDRDAEVMFGEASIGVGSYLVKVPLDTDVTRGDHITITASRDPRVVGVVLQVKEPTLNEWGPVRRVLCEELFS